MTREGSRLLCRLLWFALLAACGDDARPGAEVGPELASEVDAEVLAEADAIAEESAEPEAEIVAVETIDEVAGEVDEIVAVETIDDVVDDGEVTPDGSNTPLDDDLEPCDHPEFWPFSLRSEQVPLRIHWRMPRDEAVARESLAILEYAWQVQVDELGFAAPLRDGGTCGEDDALDIFTWRGAPYAYVNIWEDNVATAWDDGYSYMVVDAWGEFGGDELPATLAHEFNHMCQTAYDWSDTAFLYEATATYIEDAVYDDHDSYMELLFDFQGNPDWSLDHDDGYETWYMYGAVLWLHYIGDRFYGGDEAWVAELWKGLRSGWRENEPDFVDSLDKMLAEFGKSYADTVVEFARWRWYVHARDDGMHLEEAGAFPRDALPEVAATIPATGGTAVVRPMMLGTAYVDITSSVGGPDAVMLSLQTTVAAADVQWVVQVVPGIAPGSDGDLLSLPERVALTDVGGRIMRTVAITALPGIDRDIDPDERTNERFTVTLTVAPEESP